MLFRSFNHLTAIKYSHTNRVEYWEFECDLCNNLVITRKPDVTRGKIKSCGCVKNKKNLNGQWKGIILEGNYLNGRTYGHYKRLAKKRGIDFELTIEDMLEVFINQKKICPYTKKQLFIEPKDIQNRTPRNASLDRKDSEKGYVKGNVQWVYKPINNLKNTLSHQEFIDLCCAVAKNYSKDCEPLNELPL